MTRINILPPLVADMIAAGEVVERPASVIKELLENSFDAGAKKVTVEFKNGGATYIRVTDDGCGMSPDDAGVAFLRHATSKLRDEKGLEAIGTMGFRGEALAAVAAVSRVELVTCEKGAAEGVCVTVQAGDIIDMVPCGCPEGTSITIRDIFFNTPARLKFLKSDRSEAAACVQTALRCALGRPEVSVRCLRDGAEEFFTPGDGRADSAVYSLLGRDIANTMLPCRGNQDAMSVSGFSSSPAAGRGNRAQQYFFCNGRFIKSALLQSAVEQAYKNTLLTGRFPACVMYLELGLGSVDVNVHPAKTEVKFSDEKKVFDLVYQTVKLTLEGEERPVEIKLSEGTKRATAEPRRDFFRSMPADAFREEQSKSAQRPERDFFTGSALGSPSAGYLRPQAVSAAMSGAAKPEKQAEISVKPAAPEFRLIGEALNTYILVETGGELLLIDKHAAHERMIFDRLKAEERGVMSQVLLEPVTIRPNGRDAELIEKNGELLGELGFEIESYGQRDFVIRALPADMDAPDAKAAVEEICEKLGKGGADCGEMRDGILHTVACKAAIKAGRRSDGAELRRIAESVVSGEVKYCPHGRPVSVSLTKKELDKFFSRIV